MAEKGREMRSLVDQIPTELFPFEHRWVEVDGIGVHYVDEGEGQTLLLLHGNPTWSFLYRDIIADLRSSFRCVALDYPGFGLSDKPERYPYTPQAHSKVLEGFVESLGLNDLTVFGQDWGGPIGFGFAGRRPELVSRLIIGNTWAWPIAGDPHFEWFSRILGGPPGRIAIPLFNAFVRFMLPAGTQRKERLTPEVRRMYALPFPTAKSRMPTYVFPREIRKSRRFLTEVEAGLASLRDRPALILWGTKDFAFREKERRRFEELFPNHRTLLLEGAGHFIQEDAPAEIASAIREWLA